MALDSIERCPLLVPGNQPRPGGFSSRIPRRTSPRSVLILFFSPSHGCAGRTGHQITGQDIGVIGDRPVIRRPLTCVGVRRWLQGAVAPGDSWGNRVTAKRVTGVTVTECEQDSGDG
jgi:hypothetical protein